jgi:hypothetical protein
MPDDKEGVATDPVANAGVAGIRSTERLFLLSARRVIFIAS